jgi:hypothetical protein
VIDIYYTIVDLFRGTYTGLFVRTFFEYAVQIGPYFLIAVFLNVFLKIYISRKNIQFRNQHTVWSIPVASIIGIVSPLPTYLALPMGLSLHGCGLPLGAVVAFMIASPLLNPGIFVLTFTQLGWEIAVARLISVLVISLSGGFLAQALLKHFQFLRHQNESSFKVKSRPFRVEFKRSLRFMGKYMLIALLLSSFVRAFVPDEMIGRLLGGGRASTNLLAALVMGVPFYSCGGAAIPLVQVLSEMGMHKGAVLTFLLSGPTTKLETLIVYKSLTGLKFMLLYLVFNLVSSVLCGALLFLF